MKFRASAIATALILAVSAPLALAATTPVLSAQVSNFPMVNDSCKKAGQWTGFADSRYTLKNWKRIDTSEQFREYPGPFFGIFVCKLVKSKLSWQRYSPYEMNYAPGGVYSVSSPFVAKILEQRAVSYPGTGKMCEVNNCPLGSTGPAGGIVFYDAGSQKPWGRYLEVAPQGWTGSSTDLTDPTAFWCDNLSPQEFGSVSDIGAPVGPVDAPKTIGTGKALTARMLKRCSNGAASVATAYLGGGTSDWFLPSLGDINELCKFAYGQLNSPAYILCDHIGTPRLGLQSTYWSSQQLIPRFPVIGVAVYEASKLGDRNEQAFSAPANVDGYAYIRPIRAFTSPSDALAKTGIVQVAGAGDPKWPAKCPAVIDKTGGAQPQVTGFFFDGTKEEFVRLDVSSATPVTSAKDLVGCYADLTDLTSDVGNGYHIGSINRDSKGYYWLNAQGIRFGLTLNGMTMMTDKANPYYDDGHQFILRK
jgi:hypothetical protein